MFGLSDAIEKFDFKRGVKFETYASLRIRGSIIDNIRKLDWVPRSLRQKNKEIEKTIMELETELGRTATDEELAQKMNISIEELHEIYKKTNLISLISLDEYIEQNNDYNISSEKSPATEQPESYIEKQELKRILKESIEKLPEREQKILFLYSSLVNSKQRIARALYKNLNHLRVLSCPLCRGLSFTLNTGTDVALDIAINILKFDI